MTTSHSFSDLLVNEKPEVITPLDLSEGSTDLFSDKEAGAFPPLDDTIIWWNNIDWELQRERARAGVNNCGLVLAVIGTKLNDLGLWLSKV
jgi:hypothetical protein